MDSTTAPTAPIDSTTSTSTATSESAPDTSLAPAVTDELLIEEISIDGMCGVY